MLNRNWQILHINEFYVTCNLRCLTSISCWSPTFEWFLYWCILNETWPVLISSFETNWPHSSENLWHNQRYGLRASISLCHGEAIPVLSLAIALLFGADLAKIMVIQEKHSLGSEKLTPNEKYRRHSVQNNINFCCLRIRKIHTKAEIYTQCTRQC